MKETPRTSLFPGFRIASCMICFILLFIVIQINAEDKKEHAGVEIAFIEDSCTRQWEGPGKEVRTNYEQRVRLAFKLTQDGWTAFDYRASGKKELEQAAHRFNGNRNWFLLERDTPVGFLFSRGIEEYQLYSAIGTQKIVGQLPSSAILPRTMDFSGWKHCEVRKPIVLVSHEPSKSKDNWVRIKPTYTPNNEIVRLINEYGSQLYSCPEELDENGSVSKAEISVKMLKTVEEIVSEKDSRLLAIAVKDDACIIGDIGDKVSSWYWFSKVGKSPLFYVGEGLKLIDWADYDADGNTEFVFMLNGYNMDGYSILWDNQSRVTPVFWKYH